MFVDGRLACDALDRPVTDIWVEASKVSGLICAETRTSVDVNSNYRATEPVLCCFTHSVMPRPSASALMQTVAISVATILGSGILGLPVSLSRSGLPPFVLSFSLTLIAQFGVVYATTELLQRAQFHHENKIGATANDSYEMLPYETAEVIGPANSTDESSSEAVDENAPSSPSLHTFAELFLPHLLLRIAFEVAVMIHFISIMSSYALGAPQAFRQVIPRLQDIAEPTLVFWFAVVASLLVIFFADAMVVPLTALTFVKGSLLTVTVLFVLFIGFSIGEKSRADWSFTAGIEPFLMGTLALSGVINLMPKLWEICLASTGLPPRQAVDKQFVSTFRLAVNAAVFACFILNILWCIGVLLCVPQDVHHRSTQQRLTSLHAVPERTFNLSKRYIIRNESPSNSTVSLANANALGEISTVPLVEVLREREHGATSVILLLVNLFVFISISVSFMVMGVGMRHLLDDMARALVVAIRRRSNLPSGRIESGSSFRSYCLLSRYAICFFSFGSVVYISASNPTLLLKIMAGITSLCLNAEGGLLIIIMFVWSRYIASEMSAIDDLSLSYSIPDPLSSTTGNILAVFVFVFFAFAVIVDMLKYLPSVF